MSVLDQARMYLRFALGLPRFFRSRITLDEACRTVEQRLLEREKSFLRLLERGVFGYPRSPYLPLFKMAQCELGDIRRMVRDRGLEGTLRSLREAGVYVTFEEFKGRSPMVRHGRTFEVQPSDFDNPYLSHQYYTQSGGSTGAGTRVPQDLDRVAAQVPNLMLAYAAHGLLDAPNAVWYGSLPSGAGFNTILSYSRFGMLPCKWFTPVVSQDLRPALRFELATRGMVYMGRLLGVPVPYPEPLRLDQAEVLAHWVAATLKQQGKCLVRTGVSMSLRVCTAARSLDLDLTGATFLAGGEPPTPAKVQGIRATGAAFIPAFFFAETGAVGVGCGNPADENDIHFFKDILALITHPRRVPGTNISVDAFHFTSLLPTATRLLLNVESDDYGVVEQRSCGCPLEACGFTEHLRGIRSFAKLTGEGVTLVGSEMLAVVEETLPIRFGGSALDYQLNEEEDEQGFTRLCLRISPRIQIADDREVVRTVLDGLSHQSIAADLAQATWAQVDTLQVKRAEPVWTGRGKLSPLHLSKRSG